MKASKNLPRICGGILCADRSKEYWILDPGQPTAIGDARRLLFGAESAPEGEAMAPLEPEVIRRAFLRSARRCHPDLARSVGEDEDALTRKFQQLQEAYTTLLAHAEQTEMAVGPPERGPVGAAAADAGWGPSAVSMSGAHWIGPVPTKPLRLGRFLYHTGRISREALSEAISWQRSQRPTFGSLAVDLGLLGPLELGTILDARHMGERIGSTAVRLGLLSSQTRDWIVSRQQRAQRPIGAYFVERGVLSEQELGAVLHEQQCHNDRLRAADSADSADRTDPN